MSIHRGVVNTKGNLVYIYRPKAELMSINGGWGVNFNARSLKDGPRRFNVADQEFQFDEDS